MCHSVSQSVRLGNVEPAIAAKNKDTRLYLTFSRCKTWYKPYSKHKPLLIINRIPYIVTVWWNVWLIYVASFRFAKSVGQHDGSKCVRF